MLEALARIKPCASAVSTSLHRRLFSTIVTSIRGLHTQQGPSLVAQGPAAAATAAGRQTAVVPAAVSRTSSGSAQASGTRKTSFTPHGNSMSQLLLSPQLLESVKDRPPVIFYHYPCADGVFAALAATHYFTSRGVTPRYVPLEVYRTPDLQQLQLQPQEVAFMLDYAGPPGFPQQLAHHVAQVVVLDHHKTAAQQLSDRSNHPKNLAVCLDMDRSGAALARDFFGAEGLSDSVQDMFRWVEDADLWRWALLPQSASFHAGLSSLHLEYHAGRNPDIWQQLLQLDVQEVLDKGTQVLQLQEQLVADAVGSSQPYQLGGALGLAAGWGRCLGCEVSGDLVLYRSRLGNSLAQHSRAQGLEPVGLVAYVEADMANKATHIKVSLRSINGFDTTAITGACGGGGHAAASSCIIPRAELEAWRDLAG